MARRGMPVSCPDSDWRTRAACSIDPDMWHDKDRAGTALHVCLSHCPVRAECNTWAQGQLFPTTTVAGGMSYGHGNAGQPQPRSIGCPICPATQVDRPVLHACPKCHRLLSPLGRWLPSHYTPEDKAHPCPGSGREV